jgi:protein-S-isoprenylcysteine O-methyltransferase Ste14
VTRLLARFRVALGFISGVIVFVLATPTKRSIVLGLPVAVAGELIRLWAAGHLNKSREVTRSGPYRFVAHPLYLGSSLIGVGLAIGSGSAAVVVVVAVYLLVTLTAAIRSEEAFLREKFGGAYDDYRTARDIDHSGDRARRFNWRLACANREYRAVAGLALALILLILKATYNGMF